MSKNRGILASALVSVRSIKHRMQQSTVADAYGKF